MARFTIVKAYSRKGVKVKSHVRRIRGVKAEKLRGNKSDLDSRFQDALKRKKAELFDQFQKDLEEAMAKPRNELPAVGRGRTKGEAVALIKRDLLVEGSDTFSLYLLSKDEINTIGEVFGDYKYEMEQMGLYDKRLEGIEIGFDHALGSYNSDTRKVKFSLKDHKGMGKASIRNKEYLKMRQDENWFYGGSFYDIAMHEGMHWKHFEGLNKIKDYVTWEMETKYFGKQEFAEDFDKAARHLSFVMKGKKYHKKLPKRMLPDYAETNHYEFVAELGMAKRKGLYKKEDYLKYLDQDHERIRFSWMWDKL